MCFVVRDRGGQKLACVYYEEEPGRQFVGRLIKLSKICGSGPGPKARNPGPKKMLASLLQGFTRCTNLGTIFARLRFSLGSVASHPIPSAPMPRSRQPTFLIGSHEHREV